MGWLDSKPAKAIGALVTGCVVAVVGSFVTVEISAPPAPPAHYESAADIAASGKSATRACSEFSAVKSVIGAAVQSSLNESLLTQPVLGELKTMQSSSKDARELYPGRWGMLNSAVGELVSTVQDSAPGYLSAVSAASGDVSSACNGVGD